MMTPYEDGLKARSQSRSRNSAADRFSMLLCVALFLLAVAAVNPQLELGFNDDWSFAHTAREFSASGRVAYNGWSAPLLLPQIVWAAVFIKLFGFSFLVVRLSTVVLEVFLILVLYSLGRESGLAPPFAAFAALLSALSPLVLPEAVSFMSDVPAFFLFALCFYGSVKAWKASTTKACLAWGGLIVLAGVLGGMDRQIYWVGPLLYLPVVAWMQRRKQGVAIGLGLAWLAAALAMVYFLQWYQAQPYALHEHLLAGWKNAHLGRLLADDLGLVESFGMTAALVSLPVLAGYAAPGLKTASSKLVSLMLAGGWVGAFAVFMLYRQDGQRVLRLGDILTPYGILPPGLAAIGARPLVLGHPFLNLLTWAVFLSCSGCAFALWKHRGAVGSRRLRQDPVTPAIVLGFVFAAAWLSLMLYRTAGGMAFDRYLIPFPPLIAIPLLRYYQVHIGQSVSRSSWAILTLFALYGVATTHDAFASRRALMAAARTLEQSGIPRTAITAGFEYDGWTQIETTGHLNNWQIENPTDAYRPVQCTAPKSVRLWYFSMTPAVRARYFVVLSRSPELNDAPAVPVGYTTWLPPARRQVFTQRLPEGAYAGCQ